ncbi:30S ribosomal protein S16 [Propioniciclava sp. MC1595]|uniref:30S ribosomal protein S16 n=1 Tax=Propioniciclava sp. MC1595 TaxID=2760308 RepID=UPI0016623F53|nr:30S ribosomal protein S16 [Propioniciclava sp. MC1595]MBB1493908.1 30S ribosomal protein S16 [Propioniciclava sp. MC1595]QTE24907.1 30S ribosomal protein S16 [Propioniciclava sp. MC1595]
MAVKIRLKRMGKIRNAQYRIVVMDSRSKRDGRAIEEIGIYQPKNDPSVVEVNSERAQYWLGVGAQPSETVEKILKLSGDWQKFKGSDEPSGIKPQAEKADKLAAFNRALAESDDEPATGAFSSRKKKAEEAEEAPAAEADAPEAEAPEAEDAASDEA